MCRKYYKIGSRLCVKNKALLKNIYNYVMESALTSTQRLSKVERLVSIKTKKIVTTKVERRLLTLKIKQFVQFKNKTILNLRPLLQRSHRFH
jgi:hypothetical protein